MIASHKSHFGFNLLRTSFGSRFMLSIRDYGHQICFGVSFGAAPPFLPDLGALAGLTRIKDALDRTDAFLLA